MHLLLTPSLAGRGILIGIIFQVILHGGLFNAVLRSCYHSAISLITPFELPNPPLPFVSETREIGSNSFLV